MKSPVWWTSFHSVYQTIVPWLLQAMHPTSVRQPQQVPPPLSSNLSLKPRTASCCRKLHLNRQDSQRSTSHLNQQASRISKPASHHSRLGFSNSKRDSSQMHKLRVTRVLGLLCRQCRRAMDQISLQRRQAVNRQCLSTLSLRDALDSGDLSMLQPQDCQTLMLCNNV